ncbi:uncharacterized protein B4U79_18855 [Dinothrombium tinctorium]|uniref:Uncharacterized protein n=1 Tax=Dinothrombium tinctorium TaxID=1965070 RepID=A0A443Q789_9ACAR|nr:uncharacterized protein B4U79_18855 [Dinothrombium tinctorium]
MIKRKQLKIDEKAEIVFRSAAGENVKDIAILFNRSEKCIKYVLRKWEEEKRVTRKNGSGRKRKTADEVDRAILNFVRNNRWDSLISLRDELSLNVCINTIRNRLKEAKYRRYIAARKEWINNRHKEERMNYARIYR